MNEQKQTIQQEKKKDNPIFELECSIPQISQQSSMKSITLIKSITNIIPDLSYTSSRSKIKLSSQQSLSEMSPIERMNYYTSRLENKRQQYENEVKQNIQKIKIIRMKEEKLKIKNQQSPNVKHEKSFVIRKSPDEFDKQKFLPQPQEIQKLNALQYKKEFIRIKQHPVNQKSKELIQKEKELQDLLNKEKGWRTPRSRLELFNENAKSCSPSPLSRHSMLNSSYQNTSPSSQRRGSNPTSQQGSFQGGRPLTPSSQKILRGSLKFQQILIDQKQKDSNSIIKSILKSNKNKETNKDHQQTTQEISSIQIDQNQSQLIKRVNFLNSEKEAPILLF
ncbi:hypothetical protein TTHERM_00227150 (macronuclear) [Tetrahymena thermophila SB210]|uniref:Uncharacterized protein n=1 Tax=Tetrahymena thermophila (strain SB210) TaxID=312017 RepID=Q23BW7_TETTS|nr:hypothetical protein TTHERM_00227150 [Tetrahymena thermophila SB210]EAR94001.1 hypothetical protein TTHERM_00227150 [Tetrahymena thermophila SB210]|eukprot:XP_001014246.1 hypothetical protein TTHERM_00227150 [Tetrahymena thermophila SB210]